MKRILVALLFAVLLSSCACPVRLMNPNTGTNEVVKSYGLFDQNTEKRSDVIYNVSAGTVIASILFCETIFVPVFGIGYSLYEPAKIMKTNNGDN